MLAAMLRQARFVLPLIIACGLFSAKVARADGPYEGEWRQGAAQITVTVETWGADCGPRPQSSTLPARGTVSVRQDGDHLSFGAQRSTRGCWSDNTAVRVVSSRVQPGNWQILCRTPTDDPRRETGTYTLRATSADRIELRDETAYDWSLNESRCIARVVTTQAFDRVRDGATAASPSSEPERPAAQPTAPSTDPTSATTPEPACTPGAPARLQLRPTSADVVAGERACFTARVVDAEGCWVRSAATTLTVTPNELATVRGSCVEAQAAGEALVTARGGGFEARSELRIATNDLSSLIARRSEGGVFGGGEAAELGQDTGVAATAASPQSGSSLWVQIAAIVAIALAGLLVLALILVTRRRRAEEARVAEQRAQRREAMVRASEEAARAAQAAQAAPVSTEPMICPICRRGYPAGATECSKDHEQLVPYAEFVAKRQAVGSEKICPTCGTHYPSTTQFCGKDGTTLR